MNENRRSFLGKLLGFPIVVAISDDYKPHKTPMIENKYNLGFYGESKDYICGPYMGSGQSWSGIHPIILTLNKYF